MALPLIRLLAPAASGSSAVAAWTIAGLSGASMLAGNMIALREKRVKRMLAGSSIAQLGYVLVALAGGGSYGAGAALFYLGAYAIASLAAFGCVAALSGEGTEAGSIEDFRGLARRRPFVAACMTAALLSLAGLPLTAGFVGKYLLFASSFGASAGSAGAANTLSRQILALLLALNSAMSLFYYLRLVSLMYRPASSREDRGASGISAWAGASLAVLVALILALGVMPGAALALLTRLAQL
jgi:NADH-quinone oxidoreductase subunit N